jgi:hypothetical protein
MKWKVYNQLNIESSFSKKKALNPEPNEVFLENAREKEMQ